MTTGQEAVQQAPDLRQAIERQIAQRTWGRIHRLEVEVIDDRVIVRGRSSSYHVKQLALEGVLDVIGSDGKPRVDLEILVETSPTISMNGRKDPVTTALE